MKNLSKLLLLLTLLLPTFLIGQIHYCGTSQDAFTANAKRIIENRKNAELFLSDRTVTTTYVPVAFHLVGNSSGEGRVPEHRVLDALCILNLQFLDALDPIQFYIHDDGLFYVDNSTLYNLSPSNNDAVNLMNSMKQDDALNIFIVNSIMSNNSTYYQPPAGINDFIVIGSPYLYGESILSHSVGHFFSLIHPFYGWYSDPWNPNIWSGIPVDSLAPDGLIPSENQSGSNCMIAGDLICDTPPDYLFGFFANNCSFEENAIDFEGNAVMPMENNIMTYFSNCVDYEFTAGQFEAMYLDLMSPERDYVNPGVLPNVSPISSTPALISPGYGEDIDSPEALFVWSSVPGATHYLLKVDRLESFSFDPIELITTDTSVLLQGLTEDVDYYWQVHPYNQYVTCSPLSGIGQFETQPIFVSNLELSSDASFQIQPNPVKSSDNFYLLFHNHKESELEIEVHSLDGKQMYQHRQRVSSGAHQIEIEISSWPAGIYWVTCKSTEGTYSNKLVVY